MLDSVEWLRVFIFDHRSIEYIFIFLATGFGGEFFLFALAFLAAQDVISFVPFVVLSFFGTFFSNTIWFLFGKTKIIDRIISHRYANTAISMLVEAISRVSKGNHSMAFIMVKFFFGTPTLLILYLNKTKLNFKQFAYHETIAVFLSLLIYISLGYMTGFGFDYLADISNNLYVAIGFILLVLIILVMVQIWLERTFTKREN